MAKKTLQTCIALIILLAAILWLPLWVQLTMFCVAVVVVPYRLALLIPAVFSDILYTPRDTVSFATLHMTLFVSGLLVLWWLIMTTLRKKHTYGLENT